MSQNWTRNVIERIFRQKWMAFEDNEILLSFKYIVLLSIYWKLLPDRIGICCVGSATKSSLFSGYIINHLLAKLVRSRWLHTCPFFFFLVIDLDFDSVHKNAKRSKANIRASWPLVCPITHIYWLPEHETGTIYYYYYRRELFNDS